MLHDAMLYRPSEGGRVECYLCHHRCRIAESKLGFCGVRENRKGRLYTHAYGEVIAVNVDPIEKKPLHHFLPGTTSFSIATIGCNFHCGFCQNWQISQVSERKPGNERASKLKPEEIVRMAIDQKCRSISYTYTEPTIFFEYAYDTARLAKEAGLANVFVTNGYMTPEALETIRPYLDACNVDLKSFREEFYKTICKGHLEPVLSSIRLMKELGLWIEITTLIIPGQNDSEAELAEIARFIAGVHPSIPWHISRFHPDYQFSDYQSTPIEVLRQAASIGKKEGLEFVYLGNVPGEPVDTLCPRCGEPLIRRTALSVREKRLKGSSCPGCGAQVPGVF